MTITLTVAQIRAVLENRTGGWVTAVGGRFAQTFGSSGVGYNDPLAFALRQCGLSAASPLAPVDADFAAFDEDLIDKLLDFAEYRILASALQNFAQVDISVGPHDEKLDQMRERLADAVKAKLTYLGNQYGYAVASNSPATELSAGVVGLDFQEPGA